MAVTPLRAADAEISFDKKSIPTTFAVAELEAALSNRGYAVQHAIALPPKYGNQKELVRIQFLPADNAFLVSTVIKLARIDWKAIESEGFVLRRQPGEDLAAFYIFSKDDAGAMYGGLELAEQIRTHGVEGVTDTDRNPYMRMRGTKFNIPLDLRNPSYSDMSDSAQENIATVWDFEFWRDYLDALARDRYNYVSLWNLHPFPSMVKVPEYPRRGAQRRVALEDQIRRGLLDAHDGHRHAGDAGRQGSRQATHHRAEDRFLAPRDAIREGSQHRVLRGDVEHLHLRRRRQVRHHRRDRQPEDHRLLPRQRARDVPHLSTACAASASPPARTWGMRVRTIRVASTRSTPRKTGCSPPMARACSMRRVPSRSGSSGSSTASTSRARRTSRPPSSRSSRNPTWTSCSASSTRRRTCCLPPRRPFTAAISSRSATCKTLWTLRNDDALMYRWAAPDFVREFVKNIPYEKSQGFLPRLGHVGVGPRVPGARCQAQRDSSRSTSTGCTSCCGAGSATTRRSTNERIAALVGQRFPGIDAIKLLAAWQDASMIYPLVTGFHWADFDFQWYIEGCRSRPDPAKTASGFHSVETFINQPVHPGTDNITIPAYVAGVDRGENSARNHATAGRGPARRAGGPRAQTYRGDQSE